MRPLIVRPADRPTIGTDYGARRSAARRRPSRAPKPARNRPDGFWRRRRKWILAGGGAAAALAVAALVRFQPALAEPGAAVARAVAVGLAETAGFTVQQITVDGRRQVSAETLLRAVGVRRGDPILAIDLDAVRERIEQIGWVRTAAVERRLPDTLHLEVVERTPFARWQVDGRSYLIDRAGVVLQPTADSEALALPRVVGPGAAAKAAALFDLLGTEPVLMRRVANAVWVRARRWDIEFDNGVVARLPEDGADAAWKRLAELEREQRILGRDIVAVDLRLPDRTLVRLTPEAAASRRTPGKST